MAESKDTKTGTYLSTKTDAPADKATVYFDNDNDVAKANQVTDVEFKILGFDKRTASWYKCRWY